MKNSRITGFVAAGVAAQFGLLSAQQTKFNIVYIFTDQQTAEAMSCVGNSDLNTPNMDRLAKEGVRFENAYCNAPLSVPSRATMFTGVMPNESGAKGNQEQLKEIYRNRTLGNLLLETGYECAYGGKWHLHDNDVSSPYGFRKIHNFGDIALADSCVSFLKKKHSKPFFLVASFDNPHNICEYARNQELPWTKVVDPELDKCPNLPSNFHPSPYESEMIRIAQRNPNNFNLYPTINYTIDDWRRYRNAYYRLVEHVDNEIGKILDAILSSELEKNTIVFFSSDHGDGNGSHQWNQKSALFEEIVHIPLIVRLPGKKNQGVVAQQIVNNGTDLFATICDFSLTKLPDYATGKSIRSIVEGKTKTEIHDYVICESQFDNDPLILGWMIRTSKYKYVVYVQGKNREQLFDINNDRGEQVNLAVEGKYKDVLNQHRQLLYDWVKKNNIVSLNPNRLIPIVK
jgi:arylsulfatase A-like enzyme